MDQFEQAKAKATERGQSDGRDAAGWYIQDAFGGRVTRGNAQSAAIVLKGIRDGDPLIMDGLPVADMSGQWADEPTASDIVADILDEVGVANTRDDYTGIAHIPDDWQDSEQDIADAYDQAFSQAATDAIELAAKRELGIDDEMDENGQAEIIAKAIESRD